VQQRAETSFRVSVCTKKTKGDSHQDF
jgi:hypothetical protein